MLNHLRVIDVSAVEGRSLGTVIGPHGWLLRHGRHHTHPRAQRNASLDSRSRSRKTHRWGDSGR